MFGKLPSSKVRNLQELRKTVTNNLERVRKKFPFFAKYFEPIINTALQQTYPLDYNLIQRIYTNDDFTGFNDILQSIERKFGKSFLEELFGEISKEACHPDRLLIRLESVWAEVDCAKFLSYVPGKAQIKKILEYGDIHFKLNDQKWIFQVKSFLEEYISLEFIKDVLVGMMFLQNNELLRLYNKRIELKGEAINDSFRVKVVEFIHNNFIDLLECIENLIQRQQSKGPISCERVEGPLKVSVKVDRQLRVTITIKEQSRSIVFSMKRSDLPSEVYNIIAYCKAWFIGEPPDWGKVEDKLNRCIRQACADLNKASTGNKGIFIRFNIQPEHEEALAKDMRNPQGFIHRVIDRYKVPIVLYFPYIFINETTRYMLNSAASEVGFLKDCLRISKAQIDQALADRKPFSSLYGILKDQSESTLKEIQEAEYQGLDRIP